MAVENYKALLEAVVDQRAIELGTTDKSAAFMDVAHGLAMDHYDLSVDEIDDGLTDRGGDGQIDAVYVIVNGTVLTEADVADIPAKGPIELDISLIQSKNTDGFEENPIKIIRSTVIDLLDLKKDYGQYLHNYSEALQDKFSVARAALLATAGRPGRVTVRLYYATKASTENVHASVTQTAETLVKDLSSLTATHDVSVTYLGAEELIAISRRPKTRTRSIETTQILSSDAGDSFSCLVTVGSLMRFLSDENGELIRGMFDANVRDFLGKTEVNDAIRETLLTLGAGDFWWFNNGITIVASDRDQKGKTLVLTDPLLVNGLQTTNVLHGFMSDDAVDKGIRDLRSNNLVLVKIVIPTDESIRDDIIKATNSQTHIPKPYLRGMDTVHRNIEDHPKHSDLFYERRKNQYRNAGKKRSSIVTLSELAQALMSPFLFRGADARGRPNSLLKSDDDYQSLFSQDYPLDAFKNVIQAKRLIMDRLSVRCPGEGAGFRNNVVFHVLSFISAQSYYNAGHAAAGWAKKGIKVEEVDASIDEVVDLFVKSGGNDRVAKSPDFQKTLLELASKRRP